jgi:hypothetical protein
MYVKTRATNRLRLIALFGWASRELWASKPESSGVDVC